MAVMRRRSTHRLSVISLLLLVLVARALVPVGFMPASDGSAQLTLCPDGMQMSPDMPMMDMGAGASGGGHAHVDHCPFGSAPFAAPITAIAVIPVLAAAILAHGTSPAPWLPGVRSLRANQPRAPPVPG
jgi:Protein of unknown function (DUF2946)